MRFFVKKNFNVEHLKRKLLRLNIPYNKIEKSGNDLFIYGLFTEKDKQAIMVVVNEMNRSH